MDIDQVCEMSGADVCSWLSQNLGKVQDFNWLLLAELSSTNAFRDIDGNLKQDVDIDWLEAGVKVCQYIQRENICDMSYSEMNLRASIVIETDSYNHREKELEVLKQWFDNSVTLPVENAIEFVDKVNFDWKEMSNENLVLLRGVRSKLVIFERLHEAGFSKELGSSVLQWLSIKSKLP